MKMIGHYNKKIIMVLLLLLLLLLLFFLFSNSYMVPKINKINTSDDVIFITF
jgi:hypothetical protein